MKGLNKTTKEIMEFAGFSIERLEEELIYNERNVEKILKAMFIYSEKWENN